MITTLEGEPFRGDILWRGHTFGGLSPGLGTPGFTIQLSGGYNFQGMDTVGLVVQIVPNF